MRALSIAAFLLALALPRLADARRAVTQADLVSDQTGVATHTDPNLLNPWGIAFDSGRGAIWVADNHAGVATAYHPDGTPLGLVVTIPAASPGDTGAPTGMIWNTTSGFHGDQLIIVTEDGLVVGWPSASSSMDAAFIEADESASDAIFKGVAMASAANGNQLYAADFHNGAVLVFDESFQRVTPPGDFTDPNAAAGYAPFNIVPIGGKLYVTYAKQDADAEDDVKGQGNGFIDVFDTDGKFLRRFASGTDVGGKLTTLDSPWAIVQTHGARFGQALLVGNFGSGQIAVFEAKHAKGHALLRSASGPVVIEGLWSLGFGAGGIAGDPKTLYFTAGPNDENDGLFGALTTPRAKH